MPVWLRRGKVGWCPVKASAVRFGAIVFVFLASISTALSCEMSSRVEPVSVRDIDVRGDILIDDGRILRPVGILWPARHDDGARRRLQKSLLALLAAAPVMAEVAAKSDRWGRHAAQFHLLRGRDEPIWIQGKLLEEGAVLGWSDASARCRSSVAEYEALGRDGQLGIWSALGQRTRSRALRLARTEGRSVATVYEGVVRSVRRGRSITFVNFEGPRKTTPSWYVSKRLEQQLGRDLALLAGKRVRLRAELNYQPRMRLYVQGPEGVDILE